MIRALISTAAAALLLASCSASDVPLVGPCAASKRVGPDSTYSGLALTMTTRAAWAFKGETQVKNEADRAWRIEGLNGLRRDWLPTITDACLRAHASEWLDVKERSIRIQGTNNDDSFDARMAAKDDAERALAEKLGVRR